MRRTRGEYHRLVLRAVSLSLADVHAGRSPRARRADRLAKMAWLAGRFWRTEGHRLHHVAGCLADALCHRSPPARSKSAFDAFAVAEGDALDYDADKWLGLSHQARARAKPPDAHNFITKAAHRQSPPALLAYASIQHHATTDASGARHSMA